MTIQEFIENYKTKKFINTKQGVDEKSEYLRKELGIRTYIPFKEKREIAEMIVAQNIKEINGVKKYDSINGYVSFIVASIIAHTSLSFSEDPVADYDLLAESGLLMEIISEFKGSHDEIEIILKMALEMALEDNDMRILIGRFLDQIIGMLSGVSSVFEDKLEGFDFKDILGRNFKEEDLAKLSGLLNKIK